MKTTFIIKNVSFDMLEVLRAFLSIDSRDMRELCTRAVVWYLGGNFETFGVSLSR
jgi:hypothetical protein